MAPLLSLSFLGSLDIAVNGQSATGFRSAKVQALLAYLALEGKRPLRRDALLNLFWPDEPQDVARTNLRQSLTRLQKVIDNKHATPPFLHISRETVQFEIASHYKLDVAQFQQLLSACPEHGNQPLPTCPACVQNWKTAVSHYRGDFLAHFFVEDSPPFESWLTVVRERLHQQAMVALAWLADYHENRGEYEAATHYASRQIALEPWREEAYRQQMRLLMRQGQRTAAIMLYQTCCQVLESELGVGPAPETAALYAQLQAGTAERPHNLPRLLTSFWGREEETARLLHYLASPQQRLITLLGPGGSGKTRLASHIGQRLVQEFLGPFADGVFKVSLIKVETEMELITAVAKVLGLSLNGRSAPQTQIFDALSQQEILFIFDNFEHLIPSGIPFIQTLLQKTAHVKCLITSRERLNLSQEWVVLLDGLPYPPAGFVLLPTGKQIEMFPSVQLFVDRARHVAAGFQLEQDWAQQTAVLHITQLCHGMPLAMELAAAWTNILTCAEIAEEIERNLNILSTSQLDVPPRQRSIRAVFEHSWTLLTLEEKQVLSKLAIFPDTFDYQAARHVADATLAVLVSLTNKSLLKQVHGEQGSRYRFHALLRHFAAEKQTDLETLQTIHSHYFARFLAEREQMLVANQRQVLPTLSAEIDNLRQGWRWAVARGDMAIVGDYLQGLSHFYLLSGWLYEARQTFDWAVAVLKRFGPFLPEENETEALVFARMLARRGQFYYNTGALHEAEQDLRESLAISHQIEEPAELLLAYKTLGLATYIRGDYKTAVSYLEFSQQLAEHVADQSDLAQIELALGAIAIAQGGYSRAEQHLDKAMTLYQALNHQWGIGQSFRWLGINAQRMEAYEAARTWREKALALFEQLNDHASLVAIWNELGENAQALADYALAESFYQRSLALSQETHNQIVMIGVLRNLASLQLWLGNEREAVGYLQAGLERAVTSQAAALLLAYFVVVSKLVRQLRLGDNWEQLVLELLTAVYAHSATTHYLYQQAVNELACWGVDTSQQPAITVDDAYILQKSKEILQALALLPLSDQILYQSH